MIKKRGKTAAPFLSDLPRLLAEEVVAATGFVGRNGLVCSHQVGAVGRGVARVGQHKTAQRAAQARAHLPHNAPHNAPDNAPHKMPRSFGKGRVREEEDETPRQRRETERGVFAQARLATNCRARFPASGGRLASLADSAPAGQMRRFTA